MSVGERDPYTGHMTTGHEWNGIKELNTPVPRPVWYFLAAAFVFSVIYWLLMPAWPVGVTFTRGLLGIDERTILGENLARASQRRAMWNDRIAVSDFPELQADDAAMSMVRAAGQTLFLDNCAACHGTGARGGKGYPDLTDQSWLWGGDGETIMETLRVGINTGHEDSRLAQMPAFGRDETLDREAARDVISYVRSLSQDTNPDADGNNTALSAGAAIFADNCAACHGDDAGGDPDIGAPNLTDGHWIYGGDRQSIFDTIWYGRQGVMPAWESRLSEVERKVLALYVLDLNRGDGE